MKAKELNTILEAIAKENHTTPEIVRSEMEAAMKAAQKSCSPQAQAKWAAIPRKGAEITLEEFIEYCTDRLRAL